MQIIFSSLEPMDLQVSLGGPVAEALLEHGCIEKLLSDIPRRSIHDRTSSFTYFIAVDMHVHFEQNISTRSECTIHSLSWMGKVPDSLPEQEEGWKLNRNQYYQEGWLASGNAKGVVGVTFTTSHCRKYEPPARSNFNLRGHRSEVVLVRWNEPYQKLATCDAQGIIFVWIKHEGRWSIELINDRNNQVTDFAWSHDGRMALICYRDGFVLVGSVTGQRYWSSMLNLDNCIITCGVWTPDDQKVLFGTSDGQIVVMSSTGAMLTQVTIQDGLEISAMAWSCEKFNMEEVENDVEMNKNEDKDMQEYTIAVCFKYGAIYLMTNFDDVCPRIIHTALTGVRMDWSNYGEILAVGGFTRLPNLQCRNEIHFYTKDGRMNHLVNVPSQGKPLTALCWGHNDRRLFIAAGYTLFVAWINKQVSPLQLLCQRIVQTVLREEQRVDKLPLPSRIKSGVKALFSPTIKSYIPDPFKLREFVSTPPPGNERLYCTMIRHGDETSGGHYTLYLEYLGGLVPLLKGKRASKIRPDFVIYDPTIKTNDFCCTNTQGDYSRVQSESDSDASHDGCGSPRLQRKKRSKQFRLEKVDRSITFRTLDELLYNDNLPESNKLVDIKSNIWGTKFQITGLIPIIPEDLGSVLYKTSLLHLQPRQMTISISELIRNGHHLSKDPNFTPAGGGSEDEDDRLSGDNLDSDIPPDVLPDEGIPIAPETHNHVKIANQNNGDTLTVNISSNQQEVMIEIENKSNDSNTECVQSGNSSGRTRRSPSMKNRTLSPAANTVTQNNHAFNNDITNITKDSYLRQGARPKVSTQINTHGVESTLTSDLSLNLTSHIDSNGAQNSSNVQSNVKKDVDPILRPDRTDSSPRWADPAFQGIHYADDDVCSDGDITYENNIVRDSCQIAPVSTPENCRRLYLAQNDLQEMDTTCSKETLNEVENGNGVPYENGCEDFSDGDMLDITDHLIGTHNSLDTGIDCLNENSFTVNKKISDFDSTLEITQSTSLPASPIRRNYKCDSPSKNLREEILKTKCKHYSPIFKRKNKHSKEIGVDEEMTFSLDDIKIAHKFKDLESFQKAQLRHKLKKNKRKVREKSVPGSVGVRKFVMHNKAPLWNENSQVYQLDFGGRVTQESAKNFQIEFRGKQVMQFGRIDNNAYTLDFQYPFAAIQAFAVALANVTQRLK